MVVESILPHAKSGPNDHRKDAPPFSLEESYHWFNQFRFYNDDKIKPENTKNHFEECFVSLKSF